VKRGGVVSRGEGEREGFHDYCWLIRNSDGKGRRRSLGSGAGRGTLVESQGARGKEEGGLRFQLLSLLSGGGGSFALVGRAVGWGKSWRRGEGGRRIFWRDYLYSCDGRGRKTLVKGSIFWPGTGVVWMPVVERWGGAERGGCAKRGQVQSRRVRWREKRRRLAIVCSKGKTGRMVVRKISTTGEEER